MVCRCACPRHHALALHVLTAKKDFGLILPFPNHQTEAGRRQSETGNNNGMLPPNQASTVLRSFHVAVTSLQSQSPVSLGSGGPKRLTLLCRLRTKERATHPPNHWAPGLGVAGCCGSPCRPPYAASGTHMAPRILSHWPISARPRVGVPRWGGGPVGVDQRFGSSGFSTSAR